MVRIVRKSFGCLAFATLSIVASPVGAQTPSVEQALKITPTQRDADFDRPAAAEIGECTIKAEKIDGKTGWVVRNRSGQILRNFVDTNKDNVVDQWSYYKGGVEVYREVDSNFNGKADQCRWLNLAGTRWGLDKDEDGQIDAWQVISAEEVTAEVVAALANGDARRFARVLITPAELKALGLDSKMTQQLTEKAQAAPASFAKLAKEKTPLPADAKWIYFGGGKPGMVPASGDGTGDCVVYEHVSAMADVAGKSVQVEIGTLVRAGDTWRVLDVPGELTGAAGYTFFGGGADREQIAAAEGNAPSEAILQKLAKLEELDKHLASASDPSVQAKLNAERADLVEELAQSATTPEDKEMWYRQLGDTILAAVQIGSYPDGIERLNKVAATLQEQPENRGAAGCLAYRAMKAQYYQAQQSGENFTAVQDQWLKDLEKFIGDYPQSDDAAEAMMELATAYEFAGSDSKAITWYGEIVTKFPKSPVFAMAKGAQTRLDSVGKVLNIQGRKFGAAGNAALAAHKGKVVLLHYWSSDVNLCKAEVPQLREMFAKYGKSGFTILSVSLDRDPRALQEYLKANNLPWEMIYEPGGFNSRMATEMGIYTVPTMLLVDKQGRVINRSIHAAELDSELRKALVADQRQATRPRP